jgi:iron-sulfur cluster repair protein YtfE (RIC family)
MDIYAFLQRDHERVIHLLNQMDVNASPAKCAKAFNELKPELLAHGMAEAQTFYAAIDTAASDLEKGRRLDRAMDNHAEIERLVMLIAQQTPGCVLWSARVAALREVIIRHIREEEGWVFVMARACLSEPQALRLGRDMAALKAEFISEMTA